MVMGKVSKAIAAGFLCLSLFNSGGDFASAMNKGPTITLPMMNNEAEKKGPDQTGKPGDENPEKKNPEEKKTDEKKPPKENPDEKKPDDKKKLSETTVRLIIGLISGLGGSALGVVFGKCVL